MATFTGTAGDDQILRDSLSSGVVTDPAGLTGIRGTIGNIIDGFGGDDLLQGNPGRTNRTTDLSGDWIPGGDGHDTVLGGISGDSLKGGAGNDHINGVDGSDVLRGNSGDDTLLAGDGINPLDGGTGADTLVGSDASTTFDIWDDRDVIVDDGTGYEMVVTRVNFTLPTGFEDMRASGGSLTLTGNAGNNAIEADSMGGVVMALSGDDHILARSADLSLSVYGGSGRDVIQIYMPDNSAFQLW